MLARIFECQVCYFYLEVVIGHFRVAPSLCTFQCEAKCETIDMKIIFYSHANIILLNKKGFALSLVLKVSSWNSGMAY